MCDRSSRQMEAMRVVSRLKAVAWKVPGECGVQAALETVIQTLLIEGEVRPEAVERLTTQLEVGFGGEEATTDALR
ncbi:hypothetical protein [Arhodomonas sp. AD133]|uniref:hypothetical protein n=1 Tax=Arhodomonas sp. AD133 TaxID=3415009 RepID=UPI003EBE1476